MVTHSKNQKPNSQAIVLAVRRESTPSKRKTLNFLGIKNLRLRKFSFKSAPLLDEKNKTVLRVTSLI